MRSALEVPEGVLQLHPRPRRRGWVWRGWGGAGTASVPVLPERVRMGRSVSGGGGGGSDCSSFPSFGVVAGASGLAGHVLVFARCLATGTGTVKIIHEERRGVDMSGPYAVVYTQ